MTTVTTAPGSAVSSLVFGSAKIHRNLSTPQLIEIAVKRGEGMLAANGALNVDTGDRTGRSPNDKFLEDTPGIHDSIGWGKTNQPITAANFAKLEKLARNHLGKKQELFRFDGYAGADPNYRLKVSVITEEAWHSLFAKTLFINVSGGASEDDLADFEPDWTIINACSLRLENPKEYGLPGPSPVAIVQSLEQRKVVIIGTRYAGEMKKSIFYAMNYDLPEFPGGGVFPMHCSANVDKKDRNNVALFFGLSGTGKTTLSADPNRPLIGDDEHGWSDKGVFNIEGGCYAKCIKLSKEGEPQIWNAIRFGSVLENVILDPKTREPDYDSAKKTENTRVTYPVSFIPDAVIPSVGGHPKNVIFLTADAFGVLPPVSKLSREQAQYYFINGYTSKLAGTEAGVTEPTPNFSACFGGPFLPRPAMVYAEMLAKRIDEHRSDVWLLNTGWTGGPYGTGSRFKLAYTRSFVTAILNGSLKNVKYEAHPIFGLQMPTSAPGVPAEVLNPRNTWKDKGAYDEKAMQLAKLFRENDAKFKISEKVRAAGPKG
ncbi:MAG: phosphoenolpyruvate carboxykinase (ATP) [Phycisphaerales bacterium]|nr:phosphoenolpyruvate carboxykinase (ATP) [Phycisphaerales bacterium]MCI0676899.1 phosphoenolpyruvate carboxykinase (ATP) [Phycisphaerales bacterium]